MIDFLFVNFLFEKELHYFLSLVFGCHKDRLLIIDLENFNNSASELNVDELDCLCVFAEVKGDAKQIIQLYRYSQSNDVLLDRVRAVAKDVKVGCYIFLNFFEDWLFIDFDGNEKVVSRKCSDEDDCYLFQ